MSRQLPSHPNLEHLRRQAKDLLRDLKQRDPSSKLADALHPLAREYGFASWPKLKVHVESLPFEVTDNNPFVGTWRANLSKSKRHPGNLFENAVLEFAVQGNNVTIVDVLVDDLGREAHGKNTLIVDGNEHPSGHDDGYVLIARWRGARILETLATKDGTAAGWGRYEVSADDNALTISGEEQVIVLDRER